MLRMALTAAAASPFTDKNSTWGRAEVKKKPYVMHNFYPEMGEVPVSSRNFLHTISFMQKMPITGGNGWWWHKTLRER